MAELNFNATLYHPMQPEDELSDYAVWCDLCKRMDRELAEARLIWRESVQRRDRVYRQLKNESDELRLVAMKLEARQKPPAPKKV